MKQKHNSSLESITLLDDFSGGDFDPRKSAFSFYEKNNHQERRRKKEELLELKNVATHQLQRKVYKHYPNFISSAEDISQARNDLFKIKVALEKLDSNFSNLQSATEKIKKASADRFRQPPIVRNQVTGEGKGSDKYSGNDIEAEEESDFDVKFHNILANESRFNSVVALSGNDIRWILEAPDTVDVLIYERRYKEAVDLVVEVRSQDLEQINLDVSTEREKQNRFSSHQSHSRNISSRCTRTDQQWALRRATIKVNTRAKEMVKLLMNALLEGKALNVPRTSSSVYTSTAVEENNEYSDHPVSLLQKLGEDQAACDAFFKGQRDLIKRACHSVMASTLASNPEKCVMEISQRVFRGILDTIGAFGSLFLKARGDEGPGDYEKYNNNGEENDSESIQGDQSGISHTPDLMLWCSEVINEYCSHFTRFVLAEFHKDVKRSANVDVENIEIIQIDKGHTNGTAVRFGLETIGENDEASITGLLILSQGEWAVLGTCLRYTMLLCRRLEKEGLSLGYCVARELRDPLTEAVRGAFRNLEANLRVELLKENWEVTQLKVEGENKSDVSGTKKGKEKQSMSLTTSAFRLYDLMYELMRNVKKVLSPNYATTPDLQKVVAELTYSTLRKYLENIVHIAGAWRINTDNMSSIELEDAVHSLAQRGHDSDAIFSQLSGKDYMNKELSDLEKRVVTVIILKPVSAKQQLNQIADVHFILIDFLPRVLQNLKKVFKRDVPKLEELGKDPDEFKSHLCEAYCRRRAAYFLEDVLRWSQLDYSGSVKGHISENFVRLGEKLLDLKNYVNKLLGKELSAEIFEKIVENMLYKLSAASRVDPEEKRRANIRALFGFISNERSRDQVKKDLEYLRDQTLNLFERQPSELSKQYVHYILDTIQQT